MAGSNLMRVAVPRWLVFPAIVCFRARYVVLGTVLLWVVTPAVLSLRGVAR